MIPEEMQTPSDVDPAAMPPRQSGSGIGETGRLRASHWTLDTIRIPFGERGRRKPAPKSVYRDQRGSPNGVINQTV
jgi:hypothetical protein